MAALICSSLHNVPLTSSPISSSSPSHVLSFNVTSANIKDKHQTPPVSAKKPPNLGEGKRKSILPKTIFKSLDDFICNSLDPPLRPSINPNHVLSGNFAPVGELPPTTCEVVEGALPQCLDGAYIRNGPNPQFIPRGPHHLFDGDGMLHCIKISPGKATLCSRYVETYKYKVERQIGSPVMPSFFSAFNGLTASLARITVMFARVLAGQFDPAEGYGLANTSVALIGGKLFALGESGLPYVVKVTPQGDMITLGRHDPYSDQHNYRTMTAHPKVDPDTGETFAFRTNISQPFLSFFRIKANGIKQPDVPVSSMTRQPLMHDFGITKHYAIFCDGQMEIKIINIFKGRPICAVNMTKVPRLGIIPRHAEDESEMWWIDVPGLNMMHTINAWDEDGGSKIVVFATNMLPVEYTLDHFDLVHTSMEKIIVDRKTKTVSRHQISNKNLDLGVINPAYVGKKNRYVYAAIGGPWPKVKGVVKLDLSLEDVDRDCIIAAQEYSPGLYGGEPFFVAREADNPNADEDDGYVITFAHDEINGESKFLVMDAKSPKLAIVAVVKLPSRVPYGFHGLFVRQSELNKL